MQDLRNKRHVVFSLHLHLVFVTKYRTDVFTELMSERLKYHFAGGVQRFWMQAH